MDATKFIIMAAEAACCVFFHVFIWLSRMLWCSFKHFTRI